VSEHSDKAKSGRPNLCATDNYRQLHNTSTKEQFWQYSLLLQTKS